MLNGLAKIVSIEKRPVILKSACISPVDYRLEKWQGLACLQFYL